MIISILNQKGGTGKTTLATNLAVAYKRISQDAVLLVDSDVQGSARDWNDANGGQVVPVLGMDRETLPQDLKAVGPNYDVVIIDGSPRVARMLALTVSISDLILIPVQPSPYDIWACAELVEIIKQRQAIFPQLKAAFVVSRAIQRTRLSTEVTGVLMEYGLPVFRHMTHQRVQYAHSVESGGSAFDAPDSHPANIEMSQIYLELKHFIDTGETKINELQMKQASNDAMKQ